MALSGSPQDINYSGSTGFYDQSVALVTGSAVVMFTASIAVVLRLLCRKLKRLNWAADDYVRICVHGGLGRNNNSPSSARVVSRWLYVFDILFPTVTAATKLSILFLYKRIFTINNRVFAYCLRVIGAFQIGWTVASCTTTVFQCQPVDTRWSTSITKSHCVDFVDALIALGLLNAACSAAILILPLPMIYHLQISRKMKWGLSGVFILGCADVVVGIARTYLTTHAVNNAATLLWRAAPAVLLSFVEPCLAIICACLVVMHPLRPVISSALSRIFDPSSLSAFIPLNTIGIHNTNATMYPGGSGNGCPPSDPTRPTVSRQTPVDERPVCATRIQGNLSPQSPLQDEEATVWGIRVRVDLEQSATRL